MNTVSQKLCAFALYIYVCEQLREKAYLERKWHERLTPSFQAMGSYGTLHRSNLPKAREYACAVSGASALSGRLDQRRYPLKCD